MDKINIYLRCSNGDRASVRLTTVGVNVVDFKKSIAQTFAFHVEELKLIHRGIIWQDDQTLDSYGVQPHHTIYVVHDTLLPILKGIVDGDTQLAEYRKLLTDPETHYKVDPSDVMNRISEATPKNLTSHFAFQIYEYLFENIQEPFPTNATTTCGGAASATQTPPATLCASAITT